MEQQCTQLRMDVLTVSMYLRACRLLGWSHTVGRPSGAAVQAPRGSSKGHDHSKRARPHYTPAQAHLAPCLPAGTRAHVRYTSSLRFKTSLRFKLQHTARTDLQQLMYRAGALGTAGLTPTRGVRLAEQHAPVGVENSAPFHLSFIQSGQILSPHWLDQPVSTPQRAPCPLRDIPSQTACTVPCIQLRMDGRASHGVHVALPVPC
jgi:hypothetical protein